MFTRLFIMLFLTSCISLSAQYKVAEMELNENSEFYIQGSTNVNEFKCVYERKVPDIISVEYKDKADHKTFHNLDIRFHSNSFDCGNNKMNQDFQHLLKADTYPEIVITLNKLEKYSDEYAKAFISIDMVGERGKYEIPIHYLEDHYKGKLRLDIRDFGLEAPKKVFGLIKVDEQIELHLKLDINSISLVEPTQ